MFYQRKFIIVYINTEIILMPVYGNISDNKIIINDIVADKCIFGYWLLVLGCRLL